MEVARVENTTPLQLLESFGEAYIIATTFPRRCARKKILKGQLEGQRAANLRTIF